jgi:hypothetical protein
MLTQMTIDSVAATFAAAGGPEGESSALGSAQIQALMDLFMSGMIMV